MPYSKLDFVANLAQVDLGAKAQEARIRALLEDLTEAYVGAYPANRLALAVWFRKSLGIHEQHVLFVYGGTIVSGIARDKVPLYWKTGSPGSPPVFIDASDVDHFLKLLKVAPQMLTPYENDYEVLYFDKNLLPPSIVNFFHVITEPSGLMKGWYLDQDQVFTDGRLRNIGELLAVRRNSRPQIGLVKTEEKDFDNCRGILHLEASQLWVPVRPEALPSYGYYAIWEQGRRLYFLFEGGALYEVLQFEFKTEHEYASRFGLLNLQETPNDRYAEVCLRAVRPPAQSAA